MNKFFLVWKPLLCDPTLYLGKLGLTKTALKCISTNFKCIGNALQRVDNDSQCILKILLKRGQCSKILPNVFCNLYNFATFHNARIHWFKNECF